MAGLTTHVLDTSKGKPAAKLKIQLFKINKLEKFLIGKFSTNEDGRVDEPLISPENIEEVNYELLFFAGDYLKKEYINLDKKLFLDQIPIRFNIINKFEHYHVPLLLSPFGYSTYRGS
jgi:5-hydroxyisourate hydrolase